MLPRKSFKPWEVQKDHTEKEENDCSWNERFPRKPGQKHVELLDEKPLGMRYGDDEPLGEFIGSRVIALLASHVGSVERLVSLQRCLRTVETQSIRPARFIVSTSADATLVEAVATSVQNSSCVDEHREQGSIALPQFEHYRRLRDVVKEHEESIDNVWIFFSDDDDMWHPDRCASFLSAVESVRRRVQLNVQAVCSCIHIRPTKENMQLRLAEDVRPALHHMVIGPRAHGSEHIDLCVRFPVFNAFFAEHSVRIVRHILADVRFCYFVRHYGERPYKMKSNGLPFVIRDEDVLDPERTNGSVKVFLPASSEDEPNWMYFYDKVGNQTTSAAGIGCTLQVLRPDDEWYVANLVDEARLHPDDAESLLPLCATLRQCCDFKLFRLPRQRLIALKSELEMLVCDAIASQSKAVEDLQQRCGINVVERWLSAMILSRCKALRIEVYSSDFCAVCGKQTTLRCSQCKQENYCSEDCQWEAWHNGHKRVCSVRELSPTCLATRDVIQTSSENLTYEVVD